VPRLRTKEELAEEVKYQKTFKGGSLGGNYFQDPVFIRPVTLNEWDMKRVQMPERAYKKFFFCNINNFLIVVHSEAETIQLWSKSHKRVWCRHRGDAWRVIPRGIIRT
jgi:hypothetical protein